MRLAVRARLGRRISEGPVALGTSREVERVVAVEVDVLVRER